MMKYIKYLLLVLVIILAQVKNVRAVCNNIPPECTSIITCIPSTDQCVQGCCVAPGGGGGSGGGGGGYVYPTCGAGTSLSCLSSGQTSMCVDGLSTCGGLFPSQASSSWACGYYDASDTLVQGTLCETSCNCCATGSVNTCESGTYTYAYTSANYRVAGDGSQVPVNPKLCQEDDDAYVSTQSMTNCRWDDTGGINDGALLGCDYVSVCRRCGCTPTCNVTTPTSLAVSCTGTTATLTWTPGSGGTSQKIMVDEDLAEVNADCPTAGDCVTNSSLTTSDNSELISGLSPTTTYHFRVVNYSSASCQQASVVSCTTSSTSISGIVYLDSDNSCSTSTPFTGRTVTLDSSVNAVSGADGSFSFGSADTASSHTLAVSIPAGYTCSTGATCDDCALTGVISPSANNYFFLTMNRDAWWQSVGGGVYSGASGGGVTIGSTIPDSVTAINKYLVIPGTAASAAVIRASGDAPVLGAGSVNAQGWSAKSSYKGKRTDYTYFAKEMGLLNTSPTINSLGTKPATASDFYYYNGSGVVSGAWNVVANESYIVFVNGDLSINQNIDVAPGGFLTFIVKGDIIVDSAVTSIEGLYVSDGDFVTTTNGAVDVQLNVEGSVVAWGDVTLNRDMVANNSNSPSESFVYRPDLIVNMPDNMKTFVMQWSEVVPGTYDSN